MTQKIKFLPPILFLGLFLVLARALPLLPLQDPLEMDLAQRFTPPGSDHLLGTDELGRDVLSRLVHGTATTLTVSTLVLVISLAMGIILGGTAGYFHSSWFHKAFNWVVSLVFSLPFILILASILVIIKPGLFEVYFLFCLLIWVSPGRIIRAEVVRNRKKDFIKVARAYGISESSLLFKILLPGCIHSGLLFSLGYFPEIIGLEAGLSFLGLGVPPPAPGLGKMVFDGLYYIHSAHWLSLFPALTIALLIFFLSLGYKRFFLKE